MEKEALRDLLSELSVEEKVMQLVQLPGQAYEKDAQVTGQVQEEGFERSSPWRGVP